MDVISLESMVGGVLAKRGFPKARFERRDVRRVGAKP
jgi:hypothetical protein